MTFGSDTRKSKYPLGDLAVGQTYMHRVETKEEERLLRRAAHNRNIRSDKYFTTHVENGVMYIKRLR